MTERPKRTRRQSRKQGKPRSSRFRRRASQVPEGYLAVGRIMGAHGLDGELKVESYTDFNSRFTQGQQLFLGEELAVTEIATARPHKGFFLLRLAKINDRFAAESHYGQWLFIPENAAMTLDEGSYWVHDIIGLTAQTETGDRLGQIADVLFTGANEVYIIRPSPGINRGRDLLIPALEEVIRKVDLEAGIVTVRLLPGMLETGEQ